MHGQRIWVLMILSPGRPVNKHPQDDLFYLQFSGRFESMLRWEMLDALWEIIRQKSDLQWYIYAVGQELPQSPATKEQLLTFITEMNMLLRKDHDESFCGIVYADDKADPSMIKIYDPNNLGASCGSSGSTVLPGWVISLTRPIDLKLQNNVLPANRKRWWQRLFSA